MWDPFVLICSQLPLTDFLLVAPVLDQEREKKKIITNNCGKFVAITIFIKGVKKPQKVLDMFAKSELKLRYYERIFTFHYLTHI